MSPQPRGTGRQPLGRQRIDLDAWTPPPQFLESLEPQLRSAGQVMAHLVTRIEESGPEWTLAFPDVDDAGTIQGALVEAGLVELYDTAGGVRRWRRIH